MVVLNTTCSCSRGLPPAPDDLICDPGGGTYVEKSPLLCLDHNHTIEQNSSSELELSEQGSKRPASIMTIILMHMS